MGLAWPRKAQRIYRQILTDSAPGWSPVEGDRGSELWDPLLNACSPHAIGDSRLIVWEEQPASLVPSLY